MYSKHTPHKVVSRLTFQTILVWLRAWNHKARYLVMPGAGLRKIRGRPSMEGSSKSAVVAPSGQSKADSKKRKSVRFNIPTKGISRPLFVMGNPHI